MDSLVSLLTVSRALVQFSSLFLGAGELAECHKRLPCKPGVMSSIPSNPRPHFLFPCSLLIACIYYICFLALLFLVALDHRELWLHLDPQASSCSLPWGSLHWPQMCPPHKPVHPKSGSVQLQHPGLPSGRGKGVTMLVRVV